MSSSKSFQVGQICGAYRIVELIGSGGFADVYRAIHTTSKKLVALKCLKVRHRTDRRTKQKAAAEALLLTRLRHPNVVRVFEAGATDGVLWMAMELLEGRPLRAALHEVGGPLSLLEAFYIAAEIGAGVAAANDLGVVHRDLKPENVMLVGLDVKVLDLGAGKYLGWGLESTGPLGAIGTPLYMAPEQIELATVDSRTDVYALAYILYEMCAGQHPFGAWENLPPRREIPMLQIHCQPKRLIELIPEFPRDLSDIVAKGMEKAPEDRFASMRAFVDVLKGIVDRLLAEDAQKAAQSAEDASTHPGKKSVFAMTGTATAGLPSSELARSLASVRLGRHGVTEVDPEADTNKVVRDAPPDSGITAMTPQAPGSSVPRRPLANLVATERVEREGSFPSPLPAWVRLSPTAPLPAASPEMSVAPESSPSPLPSPSSLSSPSPSTVGEAGERRREPMRFGIAAAPLFVVVGVLLSVAVAALGGVRFRERGSDSQAASPGFATSVPASASPPLLIVSSIPTPIVPSIEATTPALPTASVIAVVESASAARPSSPSAPSPSLSPLPSSVRSTPSASSRPTRPLAAPSRAGRIF